MWEKKEANRSSTPTEAPVRPTRTAPAAEANVVNINIGQSILVKGELSGSEDLTIDGQVHGKISLKDHNLTIGQHGRIEAELVAKRVTILGHVRGNVLASEKVEIQEGGRLEGDIISPRIAISDGAHFRGKVDMEKVAASGRTVATAQAEQSVKGVATGNSLA
jgi:cytoskeletal protein CcmA (bactofilin family)